jgi:hypothetical protein
MKNKVVRETFDRSAEKYDEIKGQIIPKYNEVQRLIQDYLVSIQKGQVFEKAVKKAHFRVDKFFVR